MEIDDEPVDVDEEMAGDTPPPDWLTVAEKLLELPEEDCSIATPPFVEQPIVADDEEDDGPPPGWEMVPIKKEEREAEAQTQLGSQSSLAAKPVEEAASVAVEEEEDDDGPPPGWESIPIKIESETISGSQLIPAKEVTETVSGSQLVSAKEEELEDGPPPGWHSLPPPPPPPKEDNEMVCGSQSVSGKEEEPDDGPPPGWHSLPPPPPSLPSAVTPPQITTSAAPIPPPKEESVRLPVKEEKLEYGPPPGWQGLPPRPALPPATMAPPRPPQVTAAAPTPPPPADKGQVVCGSCHRLLFYPRGARYVRCSCCTTVNLVLEEHQVGQVKCGGCTVLLMYPYGAPSVRCSSCHFVTEIGAHNNRPPLSMQQRRPPPLRPYQAQQPRPNLPHQVH